MTEQKPKSKWKSTPHVPAKQHENIYQKLLMRRALLRYIRPDSPVYVPFIGDGDIADALYRNRAIYGADIDPNRVATAAGRLPGATILKADCDAWPPFEETPAFAVADFDSYYHPYDSFRAFWTNAEKQSPLVMFFTDGMKMLIHRGGIFRYPDGSTHQITAGKPGASNERRAHLNYWYPRYLLPWLQNFLGGEGWRIVTDRHYQRGKLMVYWGVVIEKVSR